MSVPTCPVCGAELVELSPDGATCARGHWLTRDADGRLSADTPGQPEGGEPPQRESQATRLVRLGRQAELWHTPDGEPWATIEVSDHREHWPLASRGYREWLSRLYYEAYGRGPNSQALQDALSVLAGDAKYAGPERPVYTRLAEHEGKIYLDLADPQWRAVEITAHGWRIVSDPPVRFRRARGMQPLPEPVRGGNLDRLWRYVNVAETDRVLVTAWLVMALSPQGPYPVLALTGEQGSGKSTTARALRRLVDPNEADLRAEPREVRDLAIAARNGWIIALDNLSKLPQWLSDALCRLATGAGFATRELYTDSEEVIIAAQRPVVITSIADVVTSPDLLDRAVVVACPVLADAEREPEREYWAAFERDRPTTLGALLDLVVQALRELPHVRLDSYPRMADFAAWAVSALGQESGFMRRYLANRSEATASAVESSPIAEAVLAYMAERDWWQGTASELLATLEGDADEETRRKRERMRAWPKTARGLAGELRRLAPALRSHGLGVSFCRGHGGTRLVILERLGISPSPPSPSSPSAQHADVDADFSGDGWVAVGDDGDGRGVRLASNRHRDFSHRDAKSDGGDDGDGRIPAHSHGHDERLLAALRQRGRAPVWELGWEAGLSDADALAATEWLLATGKVWRVGDDGRAPLSVWSEVALVKEAQR